VNLNRTMMIFGVVLPASMGLMACSSSSGGGYPSDGGGGGNDSSVNDSGAGNDAGTGTDSGGGGTDSGGGGNDGSTPVSCSPDAGAQACQTCCTTGYQEGAKTYQTAWLTCACGNTGGCDTACKTTACAKPPAQPAPGSACGTCLQDVQVVDAGPGVCYSAIQTACTADTNCVSFYNCLGVCAGH
jgi:hypothetical protein